MMYRRPDSVTAGGIIVLAFAAWGVVTWLLALSAPDGPAGSPTHDLATNVVQGLGAFGMLVAGPNILRGENWARWFYAALCIALLAYNLEFLRDRFYTLVPAAAVHVISLILLFVPSANRYYASAAGRWE
jgi:glucose dehydrogenase